MSSKELVISSNRHETKVAILEDDQLVELFFQRANEYSLAGSIHKGRVTRVLPGMQSAFVDLGLERDAFLYVSDFFEESEDYEPLPATPAKESRDRGGRGRERDRDRDREREREREPEVREMAEVEVPEPSPASVSSAPIVTAAPVERVVPVQAPPPPAALTAAPAAAAPPAGGRSEEGSGGADRRGRRSRRRRGRGRGFPESKYASGDGGPAAPAYEESPVAADPVAEEEDFPIVLPGESLAKYRHAGAGPADAEPEEDSTPAAETFEAGETSVECEAVPAIEAAEVVAEPEAAPVPAVEAPAAESEVAAAVVAAPVAEPEPEAEPAKVEAAAPVAEVEPEPEALPEPQPTSAARLAEEIEEALDAEEESEIEVEPESENGDGVEVVGESFSHSSDFEEQIASIEDAFALETGVEPDESEVEEAEDGVAPAADFVGETEESGAPLTAAVREQQPARYTQRMSRRMRRRMRGQQNASGQPGEAAPEWARPEPRERTPRHERAERPDPRPAEKPERGGSPSIAELLREGQEIIVQIAKEPMGQKGARITSHIALPGRYVVFMPTLDHVGVSRKIASDDERLRLKHILQTHRVGIPGGFIVRTAGEGQSEEDIAADMSFLYNLWLDIRQKAEKRPAPILLHHDLEIVQRILRDQLTDTFKAIWVDNEDLYESVLRFLQRFQPTLLTRVKLYTRPAPIFDAFNITPELEKALRPKVWLKSGGYIVINQTEALVAIDVNTGKYVGKSNRLEDTIVKTNLEAVKEIVRQIRLRDLGGIIVVDFIDMDERKNRQKVMQALEETMRVDRAPYKILQFNDFGLVAITRKRVKQSLERTLCAPCPSCEGAGYVKSVQTVIGEILQEAVKIARAIDSKEAELRVHPEVAKVLKSNQNKYLEELEETLGRPVMVISDPTLNSERFDLT